MAVNNNLYPGIVDTYMPAFLINSGSIVKDTCRVYFSLSQYNTPSDIANVQVIVSYQNNNKSALDSDKYPCEIMLTSLKVDESKLSDDKYYIEIRKSDLKGGNFEINQYYKVQFRFSAVGSSEVSLDTPQAIDSWLAANLPLFSEWSRVCLVRGISTPRLNITGLEAAAESIIWSSADTRVIGNLTFADSNETEVLKDYRIKLYNNETGLLISDSGIQYTNSYVGTNEFIYDFPYDFNENQEYKIEITYTTNDLYTETSEYTFIVIQSGGEKLNATLNTSADTENGRVKVELKGIEVEKFTGNITIRRTSSLSNFTLWEDIHTETLEDQPLDLIWYDYTIESGIWYKYCAQRRDSIGNRGVVLIQDKPIMVDLKFMYLLADNKQLKIKLNPSVSSFKRQVNESKIDTLGSKYPFINRNGVVDYKTFPISGLISLHMDEENLFATPEEVLGEYLNLYKDYNSKNRITDINDYTYERKFRDLVIDFLYKNNVKLFRSATEGNVLVKLMDINFTPNQTLGNYIYTFNCTAYEIADCTIDNINKYNIQAVGDYSKVLTSTKDYFGQYKQSISANEDVITVLNNEYQKYANNGYTTKIEYLDTLKLDFEEEPYLIGENESGPYVIKDSTGKVVTKARMLTAKTPDDLSNAYLGYLVHINNEPIVINPEGIYELTGEDVRITSLVFPKESNINLEYHLQLSQTEDISQLYRSTNFFNRVGQYWGSFTYKDSIYQRIWEKYFEKYSNYLQSMTSLNRIRVEADPGTVVYTKENQDGDFNRHVIGETCILDFGDDDSDIRGVYFAGIHMEEATAAEKERDNLPDNKYIDTGISLVTLDGVENPIKNGVYTLNDIALDSALVIDEKEFGVTTEEDNIEETGRKLLNKGVRINSAEKYNKADTRVSVSSNQTEADLSQDPNKNYLRIDEYNPDTAVINLAGSVVNGIVEIDNSLVEPIERTEDPDDYMVDTTKEGDFAHGVLKAKEDLVKQENTAITDKDKIMSSFYRLLVRRDWDKEFALFLEEIIQESNKYIWYNNQWFVFTDQGDLICPVEGLIDYYCEIMKGNYAA